METIFIPTDLSTHALEALRYGLQLCKAVTAKRLIFFNHNAQPLNAEIPILYLDDLNAANQEIAAQMKAELKRQMSEAHLPDQIIETEIVVNSEPFGSAQAITKAAQHYKADLIVLGTHGKTGFQKFLYGSVTGGVLETSTVPVLAIPPHYQFRPIGKIAYASSLSYFTNEVKTILNFADDLFLQLEIIHVDYGLLSDNLIAHARRMLDKINDSRIKLTILPAVPTDSLNENLKGYLQKGKPDWLVMFPARREWFERLFLSSKNLELASYFRKPMLIIQKKDH